MLDGLKNRKTLMFVHDDSIAGVPRLPEHSANENCSCFAAMSRALEMVSTTEPNDGIQHTANSEPESLSVRIEMLKLVSSALPFYKRSHHSRLRGISNN
jgi:hypothetical protein